MDLKWARRLAVELSPKKRLQTETALRARIHTLILEPAYPACALLAGHNL